MKVNTGLFRMRMYICVHLCFMPDVMLSAVKQGTAHVLKLFLPVPGTSWSPCFASMVSWLLAEERSSNIWRVATLFG